MNMLKDYSWDEISTISDCGEASKIFVVNDVKSFNIGSVPFKAQIVDFNKDKITSSDKTAGITFAVSSLAISRLPFNIENNTIGGYKESTLNKIINNDFIHSMNDDIKNVIKTVDKKYNFYNPETKSIEIGTVSVKGFAFSEQELCGKLRYPLGLQEDTFQYEYFKDERNRIKQRYHSDNAYWTRSIFTLTPSDDELAIAIDRNGNGITFNAGYSIGVFFGFCI